MSLESFKKPPAVTFEIEGEKFVIELPTRWHKKFTRDWQKVMTDNTVIGEDGKVEVNVKDPTILVDAQFESFIRNCIVASPLPVEELMGDYLPLGEALFNAANKLSDEEEARADALVGKLSIGSNGKDAGKVKSTSTESLKNKGELLAAT